MTLYRAVSEPEFRDIDAHGALRTVAGSLEGKWFAESIKDATSWGKLLHKTAEFRIIAVLVKNQDADQFFRLQKLDNIGPARFAEIQQLASIKFHEVVHGQVG